LFPESKSVIVKVAVLPAMALLIPVPERTVFTGSVVETMQLIVNGEDES
jgi:hypothetical protein